MYKFLLGMFVGGLIAHFIASLHPVVVVQPSAFDDQVKHVVTLMAAMPVAQPAPPRDEIAELIGGLK